MSAQPAPSAEHLEFFENRVRPVLAERCYECHSEPAGKRKGGLELDTRAGLLRGGDSGPALVPGEPDRSLLVKAVRQTDPNLQMPPKGPKLDPSQIADLEAWVKLGAPDPRVPAVASNPSANLSPDDRQAGSHWAFQPVTRPPIPTPRRSSWIRNPIDAFILEQLETDGLKPSPPADRRTLLRRVTYDLTGLPPTPAEMAAFLADKSPAAYERAVDRLLASPRYGERWGRYWLDVARYADTKGYVFQEERRYAFAYTYRDYVIAAFNADKPYDRFLLEQLAADHLDLGADRQPLAALGYLTLGRRFLNNQNDIIDDRIDVTMRGLQGLTVGCARCHDHKFDPISMRDYYALHGVFASSEEPAEKPVLGPPADPQAHAKYLAETARLEQDLGSATEEAAKTKLRNERAQLDLTHPGAPPRAMALVDRTTPVNPRVFIRGNPGNPGPEVPRRMLTVLGGSDQQPFRNGSGRLELAQSIANPQNPLTARVFVNRIWLGHFGQAIVRTPGDFGVRTEPPPHRPLLDYLAAWFVEHGWSVKQLHRLILLSNTYQQSSANNSAAADKDPANQLVWRMNPRRLDFEAMRDTVLAAGGNLDLTLGGPSVEITGDTPAPRRTVYGFIDRQNLPGLFRTFDFASPDLTTPQRFTTTVPPQALYLMNNPLVLDQARRVIARPDLAAARTDAARIRSLYQVLFQREPDRDELRWALDFVKAHAGSATPAPTAPAWHYGFGTFHATPEPRVEFTNFTRFVASRWQPAADYPDAQFGYVALHATGGHPGADARHSTVLRWVAPVTAAIAITGTLHHPSDQGDGVRGLLVHRGTQVVGRWDARHDSIATTVARLEVHAGDTVDFLVDPKEAPHCDSYTWTPRIRLLDVDPTHYARTTWDATKDFGGPGQIVPRPLTAWEQYAQVLLQANELVFID